MKSRRRNISQCPFPAVCRVIPDLVPVFTGTDPDWIPAFAGMTDTTQSAIRRLTREFFNRPTLVVACELLGKYLIHQLKNVRLAGKIVETEAYIGVTDKASHASWRRRETCAPMWGRPGFAYVYLTYGLHHLLNIVTEEDGVPAAVLIRAVEPVEGVEEMIKKRFPRGSNPLRGLDPIASRRKYLISLTSGPAKMTQALNIDKKHNGIDLCREGGLWLEDRGVVVKRSEIGISPRIGVAYAGEDAKKPWRFFLKNNPFVSR